MNTNKEVGTFFCAVARYCNNRNCLLNMYHNGEDPTRSKRKGFYPRFKTVGKGDKVNVFCPDFIDKEGETLAQRKRWKDD